MRKLPFVKRVLLGISVLAGKTVFTVGMLFLLLNPQNSEAQVGRDLIVDLSLAGAPGVIATGTNVAFVITVSNVLAGSVTNNVLVSIIVPSAFTSLSTSGVGFTCTSAGSKISCTTSGMGGNTQKTIRISGTAPSTISGTTKTFALAADVDPNNTVSETNNENNSDNLSVNVVTRVDLDVNLVGAPGLDLTTQVAPNLVYVVNVKNTGDREAPNLLVRSTLPKDVAFVRSKTTRILKRWITRPRNKFAM